MSCVTAACCSLVGASLCVFWPSPGSMPLQIQTTPWRSTGGSLSQLTRHSSNRRGKSWAQTTAQLVSPRGLVCRKECRQHLCCGDFLYSAIKCNATLAPFPFLFASPEDGYRGGRPPVKQKHQTRPQRWIEVHERHAWRGAACQAPLRRCCCSSSSCCCTKP